MKDVTRLQEHQLRTAVAATTVGGENAQLDASKRRCLQLLGQVQCLDTVAHKEYRNPSRPCGTIDNRVADNIPIHRSA